MKKVKYLLFLMLAVILSVGVLAGCSVDTDVDLSGKFKVIYCGNGGELNANPERVFMIGEGRRAFNPEYGDPLGQAVRPGYKFAGWAKGKLDENGKPVLTENPMTDDLDGGVYINKFGAIRESLVYLDTTGTVEHGYYDYDRNSLWDFGKETVTEDMCLIAVWERYNKYLIAEKNDNGEWENYDDLLSDEFEVGSGAVYEKYEDRLYDVQNNRGRQIGEDEMNNSFKERVPGHTVLNYYKDPECTQVITLPYVTSDKVNVIYYKEIEGAYDLVGNVKAFRSAFAGNRNIYILNDIDFTKEILNFGNVVYNGEIKGNGYTLKGIEVKNVQRIAALGAKNSYGGLFGKLINTKISDLTINMKTSFQIAVNPEGNGSANDEICYLGLVASLMDGCVVNNVDINVEYEITRSLVDDVENAYYDKELNQYVYPQIKNDFAVDVEVSDWAPNTANTNVNVFDDNCSVTSTLTLDERVPAVPAE